MPKAAFPFHFHPLYIKVNKSSQSDVRALRMGSRFVINPAAGFVALSRETGNFSDPGDKSCRMKYTNAAAC
jgi:hypothetical protein